MITGNMALGDRTLPAACQTVQSYIGRWPSLPPQKMGQYRPRPAFKANRKWHGSSGYPS